MRTVSALATVAAMFGTLLSGGLVLAQPKFEPEVAFQLLDENGDGAVARDEFGRRKTEIFFVALDAAGAEQALRPNDVRLTVEAFGQADINGDGLLSGSEFIRARPSWSSNPSTPTPTGRSPWRSSPPSPAAWSSSSRLLK